MMPAPVRQSLSTVENKKAPARPGCINRVKRTPLSWQIRHWICEKKRRIAIDPIGDEANFVPLAGQGAGNG